MPTVLSKLLSPWFLTQLIVGNFLPRRFESRLHGGNFFNHSAKSPLTTLHVCLSELEQLSEAEISQTGKKYLTSAMAATHQLTSLVEVATSRSPYERVHSILVADFFQNLKNLLHYDTKNTKLIFSVNLNSGNEIVRLNKYFFFELMQCLINNAVEAYDRRAKQKLVYITAFSRRKKLEIQVQDFGRGSDFLRQKLMSVKGFTTKGNGHGFGLWFAKQVIEDRAKGRLKIDSKLNDGTIVRFSLPLS